MRVFTTINNQELLKKFKAVMPAGIELTESESDCDAFLLFAKTLNMGVENVQNYIDQAESSSLPCVLVVGLPGTKNDALVKYAEEHGVLQENIISPVNKSVSAGKIIRALSNVLELDGYNIDFDIEEHIEVDLAAYTDNRETEVKNVGFIPQNTPKIILPLRSAILYGVKGGVGVSTITAMVATTLENSIHLEALGPKCTPTAYCYHGTAPDRTGILYRHWNITESFPENLDDKIVLIDVNQTVPVAVIDEMFSQAGCVILVADRSEVSFALTSNLLKSGFRPDIFVVSATLFSMGYTMEVYRGELADQLTEYTTEIPGGLEVEKLILNAQRNGTQPCNMEGSEDLNLAVGELANLVRACLG